MSFKIGFKTMPQHIGWDDLLAMWRAVDADPRYDSAWVFDHFYPIYGDEAGPCFESWVALSALAQATERVRIGCMVNGVPYRHPAVFANMASTLDVVSGGRLDLGFGAGWNEAEADAYGIELGSLTQRFDRLEEYLECVTGLLGQATTSFEGRYFTLNDALNEPKGPQQPRPPIVIGGAGPKRTLPIVARWADHWNHPGGSVQDFVAARTILEQCCADVGRDPGEIETSIHVFCGGDKSLTDTSAEVSAYKDAGLDCAILYPPTPFEPTIVSDLADAVEHLLEES